MITGLPVGAFGSAGDSTSLAAAEPAAAKLASGRIRIEDLRGREVYAYDEPRSGTFMVAVDAAIIALDPRLGLGRSCVAAPFERLWRLRLVSRSV